MTDRRVFFELVVLVALFAVGFTGAADEDDVPLTKPVKPSELFDKNAMKDHYPIAWTQVDVKPIVDNDRLFKKYKECLTTSHPVSCPRMVMEFKKLIPEIVETECAKCLPAHIEKLREAVEYVCHHRRADYEQVRAEKDPGAVVQTRFEEKFGKVNC